MRDRTDYLATGIGFLKTLLGTYILVIAAVCCAGGMSESKETTSVVQEQTDDDVKIISFNDKVFLLDGQSYNAIVNSDQTSIVIMNEDGYKFKPTAANIKDFELIGSFNSYDEAFEYLKNNDTNKKITK